MPIGHYMANPKFGNPLENGLGHRQITREGEKYMLVHDEDGTYARKYARMSVSDGILTNLTQDLGDNQLALSNDEMTKKQDNAMQLHAAGVTQTSQSETGAVPIADGQMLSNLFTPSAYTEPGSADAVVANKGTPIAKKPKLTAKTGTKRAAGKPATAGKPKRSKSAAAEEDEDDIATVNKPKKGSKGAPKRVFTEKILAWLLKLESSGKLTHKGIWGEEWETTLRWAKRQEKDFKADMQTMTDGPDATTTIKYDKAALILKAFQFAKTVVEAYHKTEEAIVDSSTFGIEMDEAEKFLRMPPEGTNYLPSWLRADRHRQRIDVSKEAVSFWDNIMKDTLAHNGFAEKDMDISEVICNRVVTMTQTKLAVDIEEFKELIQQAPLSELDPLVIMQLDACLCTLTKGKNRITTYVPVPAPQVDHTMFEDPRFPICRALVTYP